jgi:hypothetical protein
MMLNSDIHRCCGCGWEDESVEGAGIFYCSNPFCLASGAFNERMKAGYHDGKGHQKYEQLERMIADCRVALGAETDPMKREAYETCYRRLLVRQNDYVQGVIIEQSEEKP